MTIRSVLIIWMTIPPVRWRPFPWNSEYLAPQFLLFYLLNPLFQRFKCLPPRSIFALVGILHCLKTRPGCLALSPSVRYTQRQIISLSFRTLMTSATLHWLPPVTIILSFGYQDWYHIWGTFHGYIPSFSGLPEHLADSSPPSWVYASKLFYAVRAPCSLLGSNSQRLDEYVVRHHSPVSSCVYSNSVSSAKRVILFALPEFLGEGPFLSHSHSCKVPAPIPYCVVATNPLQWHGDLLRCTVSFFAPPIQILSEMKVLWCLIFGLC